MAEIVLIMATTHGPQLHTTPEEWLLRLPADKSAKHPWRDGVHSFDDLVKLRSAEGLDEKSSSEGVRTSHHRCHVAMEQLADKWAEIGADVAVILGNDQREVFNDEFNPVFFVFQGDKIPNYPQTEESRAKSPPGIKEAEFGHATETYTEYDGLPELGEHLIKTLCAANFDVASSKVWPKRAKNGAPHAFGHIYRQVMRDKVVPNVPVIQNTFFPPNQPSARRAYEFGKVVKQAIDGWASDKKVAVFASGGMSHFVIDEDFDQRFITALRDGDKDYLCSIPLAQLQSGTSELKSWISLAGLMQDMKVEMHQLDYVPCYRSSAGTGTANGFFWWEVK
jgi:OH-DDVA oxygenase/3-O-methylgallate 3,4-dioxygenase